MKKTKNYELNAIKQTAAFMCASARTAPKAKGIDNIVTLIIDSQKEKNRLIKKMSELAKSENKPSFSRDAQNLRTSPVIVIIGTKCKPANLTYCGFCGFKNCEQMLQAKSRCAYNAMDLGIATGSAVDTANSFHIDNRIMYSVGKTALALNLFKDKNVAIALGIPLSATGKNVFFDRK